MASRFSRSTFRSMTSIGMRRGLLDQVHGRFHGRHEQLYTYASHDQEVVLVNIRVAAIGDVSGGDVRSAAAAIPSGPPAQPKGRRRAYFQGWRDVPVFDFEALRPGMVIAGPAIVEAETTTVVLTYADELTVNGLSWRDIRVAAGSSST